MILLLTSFIAGLLTVLAPCVLPLLPIIIGGSISGRSKWYPYLVTGSLAVFIVIFTILLKASTLLIDIPPQFWKLISGGLVLIFGLIYVFPELWDKISLRLGLAKKSDEMMHHAGKKDGIWAPILTGAALSPVFASCSPTYSLIIATILPVNFGEGIIYIFSYALGLATVLLLVSLLGRRFTKAMKFATDPKGWFRRVLGVIFLIVGLSIITGFDKKVETAILDSGFYDVTILDKKLLKDATKNMENKVNNTPSVTTKPVSKSDLFNESYPAPELTGLQTWINSNPLTLKELKGKVVLLDFWTYTCINCQRTLPFVTKWYDTYKDQGFTVLGVHAPEFAFEKLETNVKKAVTENNINYPVALDNDFATWSAYSNQFWPAEYLIDANGIVRRTHFGEGKYAETEQAIQELLKEKGSLSSATTLVATTIQDSTPNGAKTPETYFGSARAKGYSKASPNLNEWTTGGDWVQSTEYIESTSDTSTLTFRITAQKMFIVINPNGESSKQIQLTSTLPGYPKNIDITSDKLYTIIDSDNTLTDSTVTLTVPKGMRLFAATFG
jgi:cytochrome c biogenesis protein CcdA/thiol-disulfide isomerase/thioredoxin